MKSNASPSCGYSAPLTTCYAPTFRSRTTSGREIPARSFPKSRCSADGRLTDRRLPDRWAVRLDVLWLWLILLTSLVRHYSSFRNFAVGSLDVVSSLNLPWSASKTQSALRSFADAGLAATTARLGPCFREHLSQP